MSRSVIQIIEWDIDYLSEEDLTDSNAFNRIVCNVRVCKPNVLVSTQFLSDWLHPDLNCHFQLHERNIVNYGHHIYQHVPSGQATSVGPVGDIQVPFCDDYFTWWSLFILHLYSSRPTAWRTLANFTSCIADLTTYTFTNMVISIAVWPVHHNSYQPWFFLDAFKILSEVHCYL